ncbi:MAG: hypothetical protein PHR68_05505, partial [Candidatus Gracilibacteria bacterium]|nr:hypothetical protein [Candidatus Gracilibacteria bacterium]
FFNNFGFNEEYGPGFPSRWAYALNKLNELNEAGKISLVIEEYYNPNRWIEKENELKILIEDLNKYLAFDGYFLENNGVKVYLKNVGSLELKKEGFFTKIKNFFGGYEVSEVDLKLIKIKKKSNK